MATFTYRLAVPPSADLEAATRHAVRNAERLAAGLNLRDIHTDQQVVPVGSVETIDVGLEAALACGISVGSVLITVHGVTTLS